MVNSDPYGPINRLHPVERPNDITTQLAVACLGAGVITTVAVAQGQNPNTARGIPVYSAEAAVMLGQVL